MIKSAAIFSLFMGLAISGFAQDGGTRAYLAEDGVPVVWIREVVIASKRTSKSNANDYKRNEKKFNKLRYNIMKVLPYANEAAKNIRLVNAELDRMNNEAAKDAYLRSREHFLFGKYEKEISRLTPQQGKVLIKLIDRQCGTSTFALLKNYRSGATAQLWQSVGAVFGFNLKEEYDPEEDLAIEVILQSIEKGVNPTYYDYVQTAMKAK
jgi:Domain of unknown function (DUF4294)